MIQATEKQRKVLFLVTKATWGGAQKYVYDLATHLPDHFEPVVACGQGGKLSEDLSKAGIRTIELPSLRRDVSLFSDISSFFEILKTLRTERPDALHLNSSKAAGLGALAARFAGVPKIIFTAHGWPFKESRGFLATWSMYFLSWLTALLSHSVIVVSRADETLGKNMWRIEKKIQYIPIGINPAELLGPEKAAETLSLATTDWPRIVTIAELTPNKGIRFALEAISMLKKKKIDLMYNIIGDGEERKALDELVLKLDISDRVHFSGFVPDASKYLRAFQVFLLPSIKEGMPYVLFEAALADISIVTTSVVDPAFFERYPSVIQTEPGNPDKLAAAIAACLGAYPKYAEHPALTEMIETTLKFYK